MAFERGILDLTSIEQRVDLKQEIKLYDSMTDTENLIESLQGRIYCFTTIPLEKRDELSRKLYEVRMELLDYLNKLGESLIVMGAFN